MAQPDLHSLILEELSGILAETRALSTAGALSAAGALEADPVAQKILAQCPALPGSGACTMTRRHENGVLALANLLSHSPADAVCQAALDRVLAYLDALPAYSYRFSPLGVDSVPAEHWFLERLVGRLLQCAAHAPALADTVVDRIWAHINRMVDILQGGDMDRIVVFALPALLGTMDAMETTPFRFRAPDVLRADQLSSRLMGARVADNIHAAVAAARAATTPARRTVSLYLQSNVGLSANHVLAQFLRVLRAVLESRLAVRLVRSGDLDAEHVARKDPRELWDLISQLDAARAANCRSTRLDADDELQPAYARILAFSLQAYADTRALVLRGLPVSPRLAEPASATARSVLATSVAVMCRTLYVGALASLLVGSLDQTLLAGIFEHIGSAHVQHLSSLTVVCLRVLGAVATFFPSSRDAIIGALSRFVAEPPAALVAELPLTGETTADEEALMLPVAAALASCMRPLTAERPRAVSTIHALFNALAVPRADAAARSAHVLRVSRSVILVLSQLALLHRDEEITRLVVGMICAPRFISSLQLVVPVIQRAASVAAIADRTVLVDIVSAALKHIDFGGDTDGPASTSASASATLTELAWRVAGQKDAVEGFLGVALRSFVDASIESPALPKPRRGAAAPLSVYLPILHALVQADGYTMDRDATAEQTLLWRNFWFHMAARGYLTEHSYVVEYGAIYTELAAKSPILVHPSSVNYLETEIEYSSILQREYSEARLARLRQALGPIATPQSQALLRGIGFAQAAFLLAVYRVELARATAGSCSAVLRYFSNSAVTSSALLPAIEAIAGLVIAAYVREATSRKWSIEDSLAAGRPHAADAAGAPGGATPLISAQVRELMVASCHHLELVSQWAQRFVNEVLSAFPQALLERTVVSTLLELVQLVWKSCKAEQDDQFVPVYWFSSRTLGITLQLPDSISYRKALFAQFSACARRWLDMASRAAPMELDALLQVCFAAPCDDDLNSEPHVGRALALEVGNAIRFGTDPAVDVGLPATALPPNASPFTHRLGQREFLRGRIGSGADVGALKQALSAVYSLAKEHPGEPLPEGGVTLREAVDAMSHAAHCVVAAPQVDHELVRLLVWVPLTLLDVGVMRAASHMWTALIIERSDVEMLIMVELTIAWTWLAQQHLGLFSRRFEPRSPFAAKMSYTPSDKSARSRAYAAISLTLAPHLQLIEFVAQRFDAVRHLPYASFGVVSAVLRILQATFDNAERISTNALVRGPLFTLVHLGFKLLKLGFESSPILESRLRDGLYGLAFRWFALPPCWSFSGSKATLAREVQVLIDTRHTVKDDTPVLRTAHAHGDKWAAGTAGVPPPPAQPSVPAQQPVHKSHHTRHLLPHPHLHLRRLNPLSRHHRQTNRAPSGLQGSVNHSGATSASSLNDESAAAEPDLILATPREQLKRCALRNRSLLLLLLDSEICRMATWANPTGQKIGFFPDITRFVCNTEMTDHGWQNLVVDAWMACPCLALQLPRRFAHPAVKRELTSLICRFPGELVKEPEALQLLVDQLHVVAAPAAPGVPAARAVSSTSSVTEAANMVAAGSTNPGAAGGLFNNLSTPLSFRELKFLLYWSAVPPITSVSYLASPLSRYPLVLQYAMRALECFPVDTTFFYVPQLVQALRHDSDGYVERAILSAAQISQLFAHQIIWNMKANMYSDEESQMPDALKPTLDRIIGEILGGLTGEDRLYYEKEFGFFGKVTGISGKLKPFIKKSKVEKKRKIDEEMRQIRVEPGVYLPSNPEGVVVDIDYDSGRPLQSHAKAPFMATFIVSQPQEATDEVQELLRESERTVTPANRVGDDGSAVTDDCADTDAASATTSYPPTVGEAALQPAPSRPDVAEAMSAQSIPTGDAGDAAGGSSVPPYSQEIDASDLTAKLAGAKIQTCNTFSSGISDAPDLIAISPREQTRSGRPSRDPGRAHSMSRVAEQTDGLRTRRRGASEAPVTPVQLPGVLAAAAGDVGPDGLPVSRLSAIFKVGDDCRQDVLALQLIAAFKNIFASCGLDLYLYPYRVVATAPGCGVIDVVPNSISRDQMGREKVNSLSDYFATRYHGVDSIQYQQARTNFVQSLAAYSVLSYLLQFKDRHNGNIMVDDQGHIVHVDFGFILDIAPGGITFESAPFKLTTEYIQVMGGSPDAQPYRQFCELCIKAYLASRPYADKIIQLVALMLDSGLPCFKGEITLAKLRARFQLDKTERDAAQFMADRISDSYENKRTVLYDQFQKATNGIPY